jgi:hypothetical protein
MPRSGYSFWTELLPKIGVDQPAVKHLLLATSSLVETAAMQGVPLDENAVYLTHYTKALQATSSSAQLESVLLACLLFACCEFMKGSVQPGLRHIYAGMRILNEWAKTAQNTGKRLSPSAELIVRKTGPIFLAYIDKAPTYGTVESVVNACACTTILDTQVELPSVEPFTEIHRALHALDGVGHHIARLSDYRIPAWTPSPPHKVQTLLDSWQTHFEAFEAKLLEPRRRRQALAIQLLRIHYTMFSVMLRASGSKHESIYEQFGEEFKWIVDRYDDLAAAWDQNPSSKFFTAYYGSIEYHMGYIPPLYFTATKCRDPETRLAALRHLGSLRVAESNWTSCTAFSIAKQIIHIENSRARNSRRAGFKDERDLIRPVEAVFADGPRPQAQLSYLVFPYDSSPMLLDTIDLQTCPSATAAQWVSTMHIAPPFLVLETLTRDSPWGDSFVSEAIREEQPPQSPRIAAADVILQKPDSFYDLRRKWETDYALFPI